MKTIDSNAVPFAEGRTAEIFEWEPGYILKLYRSWCPANWVEHEARVAQTIFAAGIKTPSVKEIVEVNDRRGIVYERLEGVSMLLDMQARPWLVYRRARELADLQAQYMRLNIPGLFSYRSSLESEIRRATMLPDELRDQVLKLLETLPDGNALCHGDFHPGNVIMTPRGPVIIDWITARAGSPWADIARTTLLLTIGPKGNSVKLNPILGLFIQTFYRTYFNRIRGLFVDERHELKRWLPVVAAARLVERIEPERGALIEAIHAGLHLAAT